MIYAPIVLFVYKRPWHTERTLEALMQNKLAEESHLYIYADGFKKDTSEEDKKEIEEVRLLLRKKQWCKEVHIIESETNNGLALTIISGVTEIIEKFGKAIILEDDIVTSSGFLVYMNNALDVYDNEEKAFHISGFMYPHNEDLPETFFYNVPLCWGWATWKRAWKYLETDAATLLNFFVENKDWARFNKFGDQWLENQLRENVNGKLKTWFIKWHASVLIQNGYCLFPGTSLVNNIGFDGSGMHNTPANNFTHKKLSSVIPVEKKALRESKVAEKIFKLFYQRLMNENRNHNPSPSQTGLKHIPFQRPVKRIFSKVIRWAFPELHVFKNELVNHNSFTSKKENTILGQYTTLYQPYEVYDSMIDDYSYVSNNAFISQTIIGKFCSIGPNFMCGRGIHPINGLSTSPTFYSKQSPNGQSFSPVNKVAERKTIVIGNDVFIGANVTILDGITIGDGAVIGAGAVVSKDIPPYAVAIGTPIIIKSYRFTERQIEALLKIKWWDFNEELLKIVETDFFNIDHFIEKYNIE